MKSATFSEVGFFFFISYEANKILALCSYEIHTTAHECKNHASITPISKPTSICKHVCKFGYLKIECYHKLSENWF